ncbi:hypothetical protein FV768_21000 [Vibrio parahaemolyticus]|uniref:DUF6701 domain-containing protein n=2 Tax=Vibrio parahaemolyticus TaxID=670 RepID=UPI001869AFFE|nr:hypothetical protein [Vibrio parahaemolyticus]EJE8520940.1 hypothetical protein [Vibrio parahaemolyticus]EJL6383012.1 hypothetical protein [Vibrio parahaemolyticus]ELA7006901.1 hypothetical protein [Vibrio parahaemolyticus]MBE3994337.1 hypothetical protein [Vibrio parahaemolyticus]
MKKTILFLISLSLSAFSYADTWQATESCSVQLKDSFAFEAEYQANQQNGVIYLRKQGGGNGRGNGNVILHPLWSADDQVSGIFGEYDLNDGQIYTLRIEYHNVRKHGNTYSADLDYFLYHNGVQVKAASAENHYFTNMSDRADVFFDNGRGLSGLDCNPGPRPTPNQTPSFAVPDNVCQLFPEPVQGWQQEESKLIVTNSTVRALGWSDEYLADSRNFYTYKQNWDSGSEWRNLRVGFDSGEQASQLYKDKTPYICNNEFGCFPKDGLAGDGSLAGGDGLTERRKAEKPSALNATFNATKQQAIRTNPSAKKYYGKVCGTGSDVCSYQEFGDRVVISLKRDLKRLKIIESANSQKVELKIAGERKIEELVYESKSNLSLYLADNTNLTVKTFKNIGAKPKLIFGSNVTWNVVGTNQTPGSYTGNNADFKLEGAYFDYRTTQSDLVLPVIYGPQASVHFKTAASQQFKGFILAKSLVLDTGEQIDGAVTSRWLDMRGLTQVAKPDYPQPCWTPPQPKQCKPLPPENFDNGSLANWSVMGFESSTQPQATGKRFRLNENIQNQATASAYNYVFPSAQNYLQVEFDHYAHSGSGGDGIALVLSDAKVPPQTGAFGGPLGYGMKRKINHPEEHLREDVEGFAGGWLGVGFDEYGNYYRTGGETILQDQTLKPNVVGIRGEGALDANGKWLNGYEFIKGYGLKKNEQPAEDIDDRNGGLHRYRIILNSRTAGKYYLSVERKIGSQQWKTLIEKFDVYQQGNFNTVPENFRLSVTASTGWATNTHEIDNFQVCADKFSRLTDGIHHFEFDYSGSGSTCQASQVELRACMNTDCSKRYPRDVYNNGVLKPLNVTLTPPVGHAIANWVGGTQVTLENQKELALQASESGTITMGVASSSVPQFGFEGARCRINGGPLSAENCDVTFVKNVLAVNVADVVANQQSQGENHLSFCSSKADADGESRNVKMSMEYEVAPVDKTQSVSIWYKRKVGNNPAEWTSEPTLLKTKSTVLNNVYFDSQGKAYFKIKYPEAGRVKLNASVNGVSDSAGFASFVSFPKYLELTATKADKNGACTKPDEGCSNSFIAAGEEFDMTITAYQDGGSVAKNYQEETIVISNSVKYPSNGALAKLLNEELPESSQWSSGRVTFDQSVSDVGAFEFKAMAPIATDANGNDLGKSLYLGSSAFKIQDGNLTVGRFYPGQFSVYENKDADMSTLWAYPNEQSFTYMGQPFGLKQFYIEALSKGGGALRNYAYFKNYFAKFNLYENNFDNVGRFISQSDYSGSWLNNANDAHVSGHSVGKFSANDLVWNKVVSKPDGPLNYLEKSSDTSISIAQSSSSVDKTGVTIGTKELNVQPDIRFGRIALDDVGGNQGTTLHIPLRVEYWNDGRFIVNQDDSQTKVMGVMKKDSLRHIWPTGASAAPKAVTLGGGGTVSSGSSRSITATQAEPYRQQTRVWLDLDDSTNGLPWLKYDWVKELAGKKTVEENPSSVVTFGIHRGNDRVIYRGEPGLTGQ